MPDKPLLECSFLIPLRQDRDLSDGKPHPKKAWKWLEEQLYQFGGASMAGTTFEGWYIDRDTGRRVKDTSWKYYVALAEADVDGLRAMLRSACEVFTQKCIYLSVAGLVEFVGRPGDESD